MSDDETNKAEFYGADAPEAPDERFAQAEAASANARAAWLKDDARHYIHCSASVTWHITGNLYPPMGEWHDAAMDALAAWREGVHDRLIVVPVPDPSQAGSRTAYMTAEDILEMLRLREWADAELDGDGVVEDSDQ